MRSEEELKILCENEKLISDFMELETFLVRGILFTTHNTEDLDNLEGVQYADNWTWIMRVVYKLEKEYDAKIIIVDTVCIISCGGDIFIHENKNDKIRSVFDAIVKFIKIKK